MGKNPHLKRIKMRKKKTITKLSIRPNYNRKTLVVFTRVRIGHTKLRTFTSSATNSDLPMTPVELLSVLHLLIECPKFNKLRETLTT